MKSTMNLRLAASLCFLGLFASSAHAQNASALYVMKTDGSDVRKVAEPAGFNRVGHPRWSHDGKSIAFSSTRGAQKA
jgi:Tol biopolymer transport system component